MSVVKWFIEPIMFLCLLNFRWFRILFLSWLNRIPSLQPLQRNPFPIAETRLANKRGQKDFMPLTLVQISHQQKDVGRQLSWEKKKVSMHGKRNISARWNVL